MKQNYIECKRDYCSGCPRIKNTRITVYNIITRIYLENDLNIACEELRIVQEQARQAIDYCKILKCINDKNLINYCSGCFLGEINENKSTILDNFKTNNDINIFNKDINIISNNIELLKKGWELAKLIDNKFK